MKRISGKFAVTLVSALLLVACASSRMHEQGLGEVEHGQYETGLQKLSEAHSSDPGNIVYKADLQGRREEAVVKLIAEGDKARAAGDVAAAEQAYRRVLTIEGGNDRAIKGLAGLAADQRHAQVLKLSLIHISEPTRPY